MGAGCQKFEGCQTVSINSVVKIDMFVQTKAPGEAVEDVEFKKRVESDEDFDLTTTVLLPGPFATVRSR